MNSTICFTYLGPLRYRGRMFKQIETLQAAGHECVVIHGRTEDVEPDYSRYPFRVIPIRVIQERHKLLTLATQLWFNFRAARRIRELRPRAVVCIALQSALAGSLAKKAIPSLNYVFDCNELSLEVLPPGMKRQMWKAVQCRVLRNANTVMHAERHRLEYFNKTYRTPARSLLLENLPYSRPPTRRAEGSALRVVYLGVLSPERHCEEMLKAFAASERGSLRFDMVGFYGTKSYERKIHGLISDLDPGTVRVLPPIAHGEAYEFLKDYDVGLAFYENTNLNNYYCAPNKVYDYIQMGMPVVSNRYPGLVDVLEANEIGVCVDEVTPESIRAAVGAVQSRGLAKRITEAIRARYSWEHQSGRYLQLFG